MIKTIKNEEEMLAFGQEFASQLKKGETVFLYGELGSGKTTFTKGLAKGLGITTRIISPTFVLKRSYTGTGLSLEHLDLYRLENEKQLREIGIREILNDESTVKVVEWPEKIEPFVENLVWKLTFSYDNVQRSVILSSPTEQAVTLLKEGKIGVFPTDTAYGIGCRMDSKSAVKKVFEIRNRPEEKAMIVLVGSIKMAEEYAEFSPEVKEKIIDNYWPGPLTIVLTCKKKKVPSIVRADGDTLALRFPDNTELLEIINQVGVPLIAPSANFSGEDTPFSSQEVDRELLKLVDFAIAGECTMKKVSTIIDCSSSKWSIIREGASAVKF